MTATPTPSQSQSQSGPSPDNSLATAIDVGTLSCNGQTVSESGNNEAGTSAWYEVTFNDNGNATCALQAVITTPGADEVTTAETSASGPNLASVGEFVTGTGGTYFIQVSGGTSGQQFTLLMGAQ